MLFIIIFAIVAIAFIVWIAYELKNARDAINDELKSFHKEAVDFRSTNEEK